MKGSPSFEIRRMSGHPQTEPISGRPMLEHHDWLRLTIGRFLAPARTAAKEEGVVEYLLTGRPGEYSSEELAHVIRHEAASLRDALTSLQKNLLSQISSDLDRLQVLASLSTLLELRMPCADGRFLHLRDGLLVMTGWGLRSLMRMPRVGDLLADNARGAKKYAQDVQKVLREKYRSLATEGGSGVPGRSDYSPGRPPVLVGADGEGRSAAPSRARTALRVLLLVIPTLLSLGILYLELKSRGVI